MQDVGVVTGASSGMGQACVARLRPMVGQLVVVDLDEPVIDGTVGIACDITNPDDIGRLVELVKDIGRFRLLAHAAGLSPSMADARRIFDVNLVGTIRLLDAFKPLVGPGSAAVCFASGAGYFPIETLGAEYAALLDNARTDDFLERAASLVSDTGLAYVLSKRGVQQQAERAAVEWAKRGGRVVSLSPGSIDTPMGRLELEQQPAMRELLDQHPFGRLGTAEEITAVAAFLLSDDASFVTGIDVLVDGGARAKEKADS